MASPGILTKTERVNSSKTLTSLLQALSGRTTTIELRNELVVHGKVHMVDSHMNTTVNKVTLSKLNGKSDRFEQLFIHGNQIRYVHIPEDIDVMKALTKQVNGLLGDATAGQSKRKRISRARLNRQLEEKAAVRAYKLGKGRGMTSTTMS